MAESGRVDTRLAGPHHDGPELGKGLRSGLESEPNLAAETDLLEAAPVTQLGTRSPDDPAVPY